MIWNIIKYFFIYFFFQFLGGMLSEIFFQLVYGSNLTDNQLNVLMNRNVYVFLAIGAIISLLIYIAIFKKKKENLWKNCKFNRISLKNTLFTMLLSIGLSILTSSTLMLTHSKFQSYERISETLATSMYSSLNMICIFILIPIFEEILFRGLIFNELKKKFTLNISIILQALIFALAYGSIEQGIYTFILGVLASIIYAWTKSIWSSILLHVGYNLMAGLAIPTLLYYTKQYIWLYVLAGIVLAPLGLILLYRNENKYTNINTISH